MPATGRRSPGQAIARAMPSPLKGRSRQRTAATAASTRRRRRSGTTGRKPTAPPAASRTAPGRSSTRFLATSPAATQEHWTAIRSEDRTAGNSQGEAVFAAGSAKQHPPSRSEEQTPELQSLMRLYYSSFCLTKKKLNQHQLTT